MLSAHHSRTHKSRRKSHIGGDRRSGASGVRRRRLCIEPLEDRMLLSITPSLPDHDGVELSEIEIDDSPRPITPRGDLSPEETRTIDLFERASPAVVFITSVSLRRDRFSLNLYQIPSGTGSGFIWNEDGYIVTNYHVIHNAQGAEVTLSDGSTWPAKAVGVEPDKDIAVLKIDVPKELPQLSLLVDSKEPEGWFPVPGMYGGFKYWFEESDSEIKLMTESWCRVVDGSGQRHEVTTSGARLVDEGFV